ncbi:MAG TPA: GlsB/YeaQ/YmgE family stress response membrane protein [Thermoanaerobaculia bacterium]|nr:GlsB/YeaQ/YmgE family stress response membrane protein [Thermoanaerobaculia bacterium]
MGFFHLLWALVVGFFSGLIARYLMHTSLGFWSTVLLGVLGSIVGGFIGGLIWKPRDDKFHPAGIFMSILGAVLLLFIWNRIG